MDLLRYYENRLTKVVQSSTTKQLNYYDGGGSRVKQVAGSSTYTYSYQGLNILYEKNVTGGTTTVTKHFYAGGLQVAKMVGTGMYYLHQDALGSTRLVMTSTVSVKFSSNYVPYGVNYAASGKEVFMYTGKPQDSATGLYYYGARFYDPSIGRFVSQDSFTGAQEDPMSLNRYIYCRDNPMRLVDLNGNAWIPPQVAQTIPTNNWLGNTISNWWNSMPPNEQHAIIVTGLVVAAAAVTVATAGAGAPTLALALSTGATSTFGSAAIGAAASAIVYTATTGSKATPSGVFLNAGVGTLGGGLSAVSKAILPLATVAGPTIKSVGTWWAGQALSGLATNFASQAVVSAQGRQPGHADSIVLEGLFLGTARGGLDYAFQSGFGAGVRSSIISGGATALAQNYADKMFGVPSPLRLDW